MPLMNRTGMNTLVSGQRHGDDGERNLAAALEGRLQALLAHFHVANMFSSTTMASSTTKPTASVRAINDRLSIENPSRPCREGAHNRHRQRQAGDNRRRNIPQEQENHQHHQPHVSSSVRFTSFTESRASKASGRKPSPASQPAVTAVQIPVSALLTRSTTSTVFVPAAAVLKHDGPSLVDPGLVLVILTLSINVAHSSSRTALPPR